MMNVASATQSERCPSISCSRFQSAIKQLEIQHDEKHVIHCTPKAIVLDEIPSYGEFFTRFLVTNQLCVLPQEATQDWRSRKEWVGLDNKPNFDFLQEAFGEARVPVADCHLRDFSAHVKQDMVFCDFIQYWKRLQENGYPSGEKSLYLKDWHFSRYFPNYEAYNTCTFFCSDWMNEFWDIRDDSNDDYRFVYMGPKGTWTPFHADVFQSFSWSANICGQKRWIFFPPGEEEYLKDIHGNLAFDVTSEDLADVNKFPNVHKVRHRIEIIQNPGETIFIPSGWYHQVENLEDTISINHNWLNGCNIWHCWLHLKASLTSVQCEISDCSEMEGWDLQCQKVLKAFSGIDFCEFFSFMHTIARNRIQALHKWLISRESCSMCQNPNKQINLEKEKKSAGTKIQISDNERELCLEHVGPCNHITETLQTLCLTCEIQELTVAGSGPQSAGKHVEDYGESSAACQQTLFNTVLSLCRKGSRNPLAEHRGRAQHVSSSPWQSKQDLCPYWSRSNVYHVLFDLASVVFVVRDMCWTPEMTQALQCVLAEEKSADPLLQEDAKGLGELIPDFHEQPLKEAVSGEAYSGIMSRSPVSNFKGPDMVLKLQPHLTGLATKFCDHSCACRMCAQSDPISSCEDLLKEVICTLSQFSIDLDFGKYSRGEI